MCPSNINKNLKLKKKNSLETSFNEAFMQKLLGGNIQYLSKALTLVENDNLNYSSRLTSMLSKLPNNPKSLRIAITGPPGAGKSTFIEKLGLSLIKKGYRIAVLAIDPSSEKSKGSILGDKTRMEELSRHKNAFVRPSPNNLDLGGIRKSTFDSLRLCESAGFDIILVETVGVGQSEVQVSQITDLFVLVLTPGGGDELQGIKKGIVEMADIIIVNKYDGDQKIIAEKTKKDYAHATHLIDKSESVLTKVELHKVSSIEETGIDKIKTDFINYMNDEVIREKINAKRIKQENLWFKKQAEIMTHQIFFQNEKFKKEFDLLSSKIENSSINVFDAIHKLSQIITTSISI